LAICASDYHRPWGQQRQQQPRSGPSRACPRRFCRKAAPFPRPMTPLPHPSSTAMRSARSWRPSPI